MRARPLAAVALLAFLAAPLAAGHGAPAGDVSPNGPFFRVLADYSDDCGGHGAASTCQGTLDLIALDVQEKADAASGELVVFRFTLDAGQTGATLKATTTFQAGGAQKSFSIQSTDNSHFTGSADQVLDARPLNDGTRFQVDAVLKLSSLGSVGDRLGGFQVESVRGSTKGDLMPGTYKTPLGTDGPAPANDPTCGCPRSVAYALQGPTYYLGLNPPSGTQMASNGQDLPVPIQLGLENKLNRAQTITVTATGADGVTAGFHAGGDGMHVEYKPQAEVALGAQDRGTTLHLNLHGERAGTSGTLTITATSDLGGRTTVQVPYTVKEASADGDPAPATHERTSKSSPAPAALLLGLALLGAALRRRA
ncbi:MAG TPA: hypothetical protein VM241_00605 [Candidatus Thermoplasmatota archaeon]|nr:hypothetical protein [Candidatus Thermoplasmatota archaeon]